MTSASRARTHIILDTSARPYCIRKYTLPIGYYTYLQPGLVPNIFDANVNRIAMHCVIAMQVELGGYRVSLDFIICSLLATTCIMGTYFCDPFDEVIRPNLKSVEISSKTIIPIIRNPRTQAPALRSPKKLETAQTATRSPHVREA